MISTKGLQNIHFNDNKDFRFIVCDEIIECNRIQAEFLSPTISHLYSVDKTFDSYQIDVCCSKNKNENIKTLNKQEIISEFKRIFRLSTGESLFNSNVNEDSLFLMKLISTKLGNEELIELIDLKLYEQNDEGKNKSTLNTFQEISKNKFYGISVSKELGYLSENLYLILENFNENSKSDDIKDEDKKKQLLKLAIEDIFEILSNPLICINDEDSLFDFLIEYKDEREKNINKNKKEKGGVQNEIKRKNKGEIENEETRIKELFGFIEIGCLKNENLKRFFEIINYKEMSDINWESMIERTLSNMPQLQCTSNQNRHYLNEIFDRLNKIAGGNCHEKGLVNISCSSNESDERQCWKIVDRNWEKYWSSGNVSNSWLLIDFKERKITLNEYSIKVKQTTDNPKSWKIEGSNDQKNWVCIDDRKDDIKMKERYSVGKWVCNSKNPYRYFKFTQTDLNHSNGNFFCIAQLEFFGRIL